MCRSGTGQGLASEWLTVISTIPESSKRGLENELELGEHRQDIKCHEFREVKCRRVMRMSVHLQGPPVLMIPLEGGSSWELLQDLFRHNWQIKLYMCKSHSDLTWYTYALGNDYPNLTDTLPEICSLCKLPGYHASLLSVATVCTTKALCPWDVSLMLPELSVHKEQRGQGGSLPEFTTGDSLSLEFNHIVFILFL